MLPNFAKCGPIALYLVSNRQGGRWDYKNKVGLLKDLCDLIKIAEEGLARGTASCYQRCFKCVNIRVDGVEKSSKVVNLPKYFCFLAI